jgi:hypothetical protein
MCEGDGMRGEKIETWWDRVYIDDGTHYVLVDAIFKVLCDEVACAWVTIYHL